MGRGKAAMSALDPVVEKGLAFGRLRGTKSRRSVSSRLPGLNVSRNRPQPVCRVGLGRPGSNSAPDWSKRWFSASQPGVRSPVRGDGPEQCAGFCTFGGRRER